MLSFTERMGVRLRTGWSDRILSNIGSMEEASIYIRAGLKYNVPQISDRRLSQKKTITLQRNGKDNTKKVHP